MVRKTPTATFSQPVTIVAAGLSSASRDLVSRALPECHFLACEVNSWQVVRFCKLVGLAILIIDYESIVNLKNQRIAVIEYLSATQVLVLSRACDNCTYDIAVSAGCSGVLPRTSTPAQLDRKSVV